MSMMANQSFGIFNSVGYVFGYVLWFFFTIFQNFGVSIFFFTLLMRVILFPFSVKQQISMSESARLAEKQREIQKRYANDKQRQNEEMAKLYQQEGFNPLGGCLTSLLPLVFMMGVFWAVVSPLRNTLHIAAEKVASAIALLGSIPGIGTSFRSTYGEIEIIRLFPYIKGQLSTFSAEDIQSIEELHRGFDFLGLDLLGTPKTASFSSMLWLIPLLSLLLSLLTTYFTQRKQVTPQQSSGCMKFSMYLVPIFSTWISYTVPAAVGMYWIFSTLIGLGQTLLMNHFYSPQAIAVKKQAARIVRNLQREAEIQPLPQVNNLNKSLVIEKSHEVQTIKSLNVSKEKAVHGAKGKHTQKTKKNKDTYRGKKK